ncbi:hypothetical protein [Bacillus sp. YC2]|uniref:hypothetical protein n=1 Tax=Bacillus sp. YC2 TaxID=2861287 RepID=UPI00223C4507|nr:hypothetical protein [Bacillus sp. YC2]
MDKLQEIISDLSLWHLASEEELKPLDINAGPCYIIEQSYVKDIMIGFMKKQQSTIEEHQRQQDIAVNQFRQTQEDIQRLQAENKRYRETLKIYADENSYRRTLRLSEWNTVEMEKKYGDFNPSFMEVDRGQTARKALEGAAE